MSLFAEAPLGEVIHNLKYERSYYTAKKKARNENKIVMVMMAVKGCPNCAYMKDIVFERENILNYLNENFVVVIYDVDRDKGIYPKRFSTTHGPTFFFIDPRDEKDLKEKHVGGWRDFKFIEILKEVKAKYDKKSDNLTDVEQK
jgi:thioredoxin-related protein